LALIEGVLRCGTSEIATDIGCILEFLFQTDPGSFCYSQYDGYLNKRQNSTTKLTLNDHQRRQLHENNVDEDFVLDKFQTLFQSMSKKTLQYLIEDIEQNYIDDKSGKCKQKKSIIRYNFLLVTPSYIC
jgi:hypothetical protein